MNSKHKSKNWKLDRWPSSKDWKINRNSRKERSLKRLKSYRKLCVSNNRDFFNKEIFRWKKIRMLRCKCFKPKRENLRKEQEWCKLTYKVKAKVLNNNWSVNILKSAVTRLRMQTCKMSLNSRKTKKCMSISNQCQFKNQRIPPISSPHSSSLTNWLSWTNSNKQLTRASTF